MGKQFRGGLTYAVIYGLIWLTAAQINAFASYVALYVPIWWVFVFFPAMQHSRRAGLLITVLSGLFFESQYVPLRGILLPVMLGMFALLLQWRSRTPDSGNRVPYALASLTHWILVMFPSVLLWYFERVPAYEGFWVRVLIEGACGQLLLLLLLPLLSLLWFRMEGYRTGEDLSGTVS